MQEGERKTRDKGPAPSPPMAQSSTPTIPTPTPPTVSQATVEKGPAPQPPINIIPTPPASPLTPPQTPPAQVPPIEQQPSNEAVVQQDVLDATTSKKIVQPVQPKIEDIDEKSIESKVIPVKPALSQEPSREGSPVIAVVSPQQNKNTSMVTIITDLPDLSNSLNSNVSQVTVVTTHPPILVDNSTHPKSEVTVISNETNKTSVNESSTDEDCYPSLDSLEYPHPQAIHITPENKLKPRGQKLDESEVIILNSSYISVGDTSQLDNTANLSNLLDTSHVSVVTVGEKDIKVKDSATVIYAGGDNKASSKKLRGSSSSDLSIGRSDSSDELRTTNKSSIIVETGTKSNQTKMNGQALRSASRDDIHIVVNKKTSNAKKSVSPESFESVESRSHSECGSVRSSGSPPSAASKSFDRSDAESITTTISQDSHGSNKENKQGGRTSSQSGEIEEGKHSFFPLNFQLCDLHEIIKHFPSVNLHFLIIINFNKWT